MLKRVLVTLTATAIGSMAANAQAAAATPISGVLGKIASVTSTSLQVQTKNGVVTIEVEQPLTTYRQEPSDLSHVTAGSYVGIPSVKQQNGTEQASMVMIFPAVLRGAAEGSVLLEAPRGATAQSRMTNGSVARPAPTSRMTNGTVRKGARATLVVHYQDGTQTISLPSDVPVTEITPETVTLAPGDTVYVATQTLPNGTPTTNKVFQFIAASTSHN